MKNGITIKSHVVLFMDVHDYSIAVNVLGTGLYGFLQQVYEELGDIIVEYEGEIVKYLGDAILCVFPAGSERKVVRCSLELRRAFANMVNRKNLPRDTELEIGIGSGEVETGVFGHKSLMQKDVFGREVVAAATIGHHRGIAVTERVYDKIKTSYVTRRLPELEVKWQDEPLKVWEIIE
jgi:adenylate cyclase